LLAVVLAAFASFGCTKLEPVPPPGTGADKVVDPRLDSDKDGVPDLVEQTTGTDLDDATSFPRDTRERGECPTGWNKRDMRCFSGLNWYRTYASAVVHCRGMEWYYRVPIRVATHEDLSYLYMSYPTLAPSYNPQGHWIGNIVGDDRVLCGNRAITSPTDEHIRNFEGTCNKSNQRRFWCVMELSLYEANH
jgi:hypothetical protein